MSFSSYRNNIFLVQAVLHVSEQYDFCSKRYRFSEPQKTTQISIFYKQIRFSEPFSIVTRFREPNLPVPKPRIRINTKIYNTYYIDN
jgi:hypothetical protein